MRYQWWQLGECAERDVKLFIIEPHHGDRPPDYARINAAKRICARCPVAADCIEAADLEGDRASVRGGLTPAERRALRRKERESTAA
jgi:WhiB family redox-sensing transcriptional regulator